MTDPAGRPAPGDEARDPVSTLLERAGRGDEAAFATLYAETAPRALGLAVRVVRDRHLAEDAIQEAYLKIWRTASRYDAARSSGINFVLMVVHRTAVTQVRASQSRAVRDDRHHRDASTLRGAEDAPTHDPTHDRVFAAVRAESAGAAFSLLSPAQREALGLAYFGGCTHREVAELLGVPPGTAKTRIRDGLLRLRAHLSHLAPAESAS